MNHSLGSVLRGGGICGDLVTVLAEAKLSYSVVLFCVRHLRGADDYDVVWGLNEVNRPGLLPS